jgi:hypothetical protein
MNIRWQESMNGVTIDCSIDVRIHPVKDCKVVFLIIPGVDGDVDGYDNKYIKIAESVQEKHNIAVVRISNPFISSFFWESNVIKILEYIKQNSKEICGNSDYEIRAQGYSAGAAVIATIANEYSEITSLLLINAAMKLNEEAILDGLDKFKGKTTVVFGENDPSVKTASLFNEINNLETVIIEGADHFFSEKSFEDFIGLANKHLFEDNK